MTTTSVVDVDTPTTNTTALELPHILVALHVRGTSHLHDSARPRRQRLRVLRERRINTAKENVTSYTVASIAWDDAAPTSSLLVMDAPDTTSAQEGNGILGMRSLPRVVLCRSPYVCVSDEVTGNDTPHSTIGCSSSSSSFCSCEALTRRVVHALCEPKAELLTCIVGSQSNLHTSSSTSTVNDGIDCSCCSKPTDVMSGLFAKVVHALFANTRDLPNTHHRTNSESLCRAVAVSVIEVRQDTRRATEGNACSTIQYATAIDLLSEMRDHTPLSLNTESDSKYNNASLQAEASSDAGTTTGCFMEHPCDIPATRYIRCSSAVEAVSVLHRALAARGTISSTTSDEEELQRTNTQLFVTLLVSMQGNSNAASVDDNVHVWKLWDLSTTTSVPAASSNTLNALHRASLTPYNNSYSSCLHRPHDVGFELTWQSILHSCSTFMLLGLLEDNAKCETCNEIVLETASAWAELTEPEACEPNTNSSNSNVVDDTLSGLTRLLRADTFRSLRRRDNVAAAARVLATFALSYADYMAMSTTTTHSGDVSCVASGPIVEEEAAVAGNVFDVSTIAPSGCSSSQTFLLPSPTPPIPPHTTTTTQLQLQPNERVNRQSSKLRKESDRSEGTVSVDQASLSRLASLLTRSSVLAEPSSTTTNIVPLRPPVVTVSASHCSTRMSNEDEDGTHKTGTSASNSNGMTPSGLDECTTIERRVYSTTSDKKRDGVSCMAPCLRTLCELTAAVEALQQQLSIHGIMPCAEQTSDMTSPEEIASVPQAMSHVRQVTQRLSAQLCHLVESRGKSVS